MSNINKDKNSLYDYIDKHWQGKQNELQNDIKQAITNKKFDKADNKLMFDAVNNLIETIKNSSTNVLAEIKKRDNKPISRYERTFLPAAKEKYNSLQGYIAELESLRANIHEAIYFSTNNSHGNSINSLAEKLTEFAIPTSSQNNPTSIYDILKNNKAKLLSSQIALDKITPKEQQKAITSLKNNKEIEKIPSIFNILQWNKRRQYIELKTRFKLNEILNKANMPTSSKNKEIDKVINANKPFWPFGKEYNRYQLLKNKAKIINEFDAFVKGRRSNTEFLNTLNQFKSKLPQDYANQISAIIEKIDSPIIKDSTTAMEAKLLDNRYAYEVQPDNQDANEGQLDNRYAYEGRPDNRYANADADADADAFQPANKP